MTNELSVTADKVRLADQLLEDGSGVVVQIRRVDGDVILHHSRGTTTLPAFGRISVRRLAGRIIDHDAPELIYSTGCYTPR